MERRGPDEGGGREERRTSLTDSEVEDEVYSECLVSLSPGGGGGAALLPGALRHLQPRSPYTRDHRRRSAGKRQAPQPPSRPSPTTTPAPAPTPSPDTTPTPSLRPTPTSSPAPTPTPSPTPVTTVQMVLDSGVPSQSFTHLVSHPVLAPLGPATPTHLVSHPVLAPLGPATPTRSASSLTAARNLRIRLIDDDSDSESHLSDSFEEHIVFPRPGPAPGPPLVSQVVVTSTQVMTQTHLDLTSSSPPTRPPPAPTPLQVSSPGMPPPAPRAPGVVCRGRTRRLVHSSSDPGLPRHLRFQPPRSPSLAAAWPLDQVSEEEGEDGVGAGRGGLERSDSTVTVATLQEELLVAPRLKLRVTLTNITALVLVTALAAPHATILLYTSFRLVFGTLFPAYYSYKAVKTKNVKEYVKWMMYWIVFAFFTCFETLTDLFVSFWFPFYYELKILVVLWLLSPATRGSSILYRKFVHPWLARREEDIDQCIAQARQQGYSTVVQLGTKGVNYATTVLMQTAIKGGGGLMNQLRRSYSQSELVGEEGGDMNRNVKALPPHYPQDHYASDYSLDHHTHTSGGQYELERRGRAESDAAYKPRGSSANRGIRSTKTRSADVTEVYYQDVPDEGSLRRRSPRTHDPGSRVLSADDLTSGYSSGDPDPADLISADVRGRPRPDPQDTVGPMPETEQPRGLGKVRRTQSLSASTLSLHRTSKRGGGEAGRPGLRSGRGSGAADDPGAPHASYSGQGQPSGHHGAGFRRSRPGEVSAYATLPRAAGKRTAAAAAAKKRQV